METSQLIQNMQGRHCCISENKLHTTEIVTNAQRQSLWNQRILLLSFLHHTEKPHHTWGQSIRRHGSQGISYYLDTAKVTKDLMSEKTKGHASDPLTLLCQQHLEFLTSLTSTLACFLLLWPYLFSLCVGSPAPLYQWVRIPPRLLPVGPQ